MKKIGGRNLSRNKAATVIDRRYKVRKLLAPAAHDDVPMRAGVAPAGVDGKYDAGGDEDLSDGHDPCGPHGYAEAFACCITQEEETDHDHLRGGLGFSGRISGQHGAVGEGELTQAGDEEVARDEDDRSPCGNVMRPNEQDERGGDEDFVGQRIHQASEVGLALHAPGEDAVEVIAEHGEGESNRRDGRAPRESAFARGDEQHGEREAQDGELVGDGHGGKAVTLAKGERGSQRICTEGADGKRGGKRFFERSFDGPV
jgi:hypothetical protein